jgi:hypothetical protein
MKRLTCAGLLALCMCVVGVALAETASARVTPGVLPERGAFTDEAVGSPEFVAKGLLGESAFECAHAPSLGSFITSLLGTLDVLFTGCLVNEIVLLLCTGLMDTAGSSSMLALGTFHLRYREPAHGQSVFAFLLRPLHFTCVNGTTEVLLEAGGCIAGSIGPTNVPIKLPQYFVMTLGRSSVATRNEITKIENEAGNGEETCQLSAKEGTGAAAQASMTTTFHIFPLVADGEIMA